MPVPGKNETQKEFISRCIPFVLKDGAAKNQSQAVAICHGLWEKKGAKMTVGTMRMIAARQFEGKELFIESMRSAVEAEFKTASAYAYMEDVDVSSSVVIVNIDRSGAAQIGSSYYAVPYTTVDGKIVLNSVDKYEVQRNTVFARIARKFAIGTDLFAAKPKFEKTDDGLYETWIQIFPAAGTEWQYPVGRAKDGKAKFKKISYTTENYEGMIANFEAQDAVQIATNYEHIPTLATEQGKPFTPEQGRASGWIRKLEVRDDGLYALWAATEAAKKFVEAGEYKYFSPEWRENAEDQHTAKSIGMKLTGGALVNDPFFEGMEEIKFETIKRAANKVFARILDPVPNPTEVEMELSKIAEALGLDIPEGQEAWTDELLSEKLASQRTELDELRAAKAVAKSDEEVVGDLDEIKAQVAKKDTEIEALKSEIETLRKASKDDFKEMAEKVAKLESERVARKKAELISGALKAGKIASEDQGVLIGKYFDRCGEEETLEFIAKMSTVIDPERHGTSEHNAQVDELKLSDVEKNMAKDLGVTEESMLKAKKLEIEGS